MKKRILYLIGVALIVVGGLFVLAGAAMADFDPYVFSAGMVPTEKTVTFKKDEVTAINVRENRRVAVSVVPRRTDTVTVTYDDSRFASQNISVEGGVLTLSAENRVRWFDYLSIGGVDSVANVEIAVPDDLAVSLNVSSDCCFLNVSAVTLTELHVGMNDANRYSSVHLGGTTVEGTADVSVSNGDLEMNDVTFGGEFIADFDCAQVVCENCTFAENALLSPQNSVVKVNLAKAAKDFTVSGYYSEYVLSYVEAAGKFTVSATAGRVNMQNVTCADLAVEEKGYEKGYKYSFITDGVKAKNVSADLNCAYFSMTRPDISESITVTAWGSAVAVDGIDVPSVSVDGAETPVYVRSTGKALDYTVAASTSGEGSVYSNDSRLTKSHKKIDVNTTNADVILLYGEDRVYTKSGDTYVPGASFKWESGWKVEFVAENGKCAAIVSPLDEYEEWDTDDESFNEKRFGPDGEPAATMPGEEVGEIIDRSGDIFNETEPFGEAVIEPGIAADETVSDADAASESAAGIPETTVPTPYTETVLP